MSAYSKDELEKILYATGYLIAYPLAGAGAYLLSKTVSYVKATRDVLFDKKRRKGLVELANDYFEEDLNNNGRFGSKR